ncbi:MAG: ABC transporter substrate-binding protein [Gammaproteobacteria bacterium]|nr:ABC transporter substrate-binding protein [Gammaproteobacteria bacterium]
MWCTDDDCTWKNYHPYIFALDDTPSVSAKAFAQEVAKLEISRWSTVAASVAYGHKFTDAFKFELKALRPDVEFISEQWPAMFKTDMGPVVQAVKSTDPQGVFLILFGQDLFEYIREAKKRGISKSVLHVAPSLGWPEEMEVMGDEVPEGWLVMGYPGDELAMPEHLEFRRRYEARFDQSLGFSGLDGHLLFTLFKNAVEKAGSVDAEAIVKAAEGLTIDTPIGDVSMRAIDHRSTRGYWIGRTVYRNGKPTIENYNRSDVEKLSPSDEWILAQRATK